MKLNPAGNATVLRTYLGGSGSGWMPSSPSPRPPAARSSTAYLAGHTTITPRESQGCERQRLSCRLHTVGRFSGGGGGAEPERRRTARFHRALRSHRKLVDLQHVPRWQRRLGGLSGGCDGNRARCRRQCLCDRRSGSGSGTSQTFAFLFNDPAGVRDHFHRLDASTPG